ncbi:MAG: DUF2911 domain-containing protein, partial [Candidatus Acidiferrales bacterium]
MRKVFIVCSTVALLVAAMMAMMVTSHAQEDKSKRPSPAAHAEFQFTDGKTVIVDYSSPRAKGRKIYGGLVPYGEVWRAGANEATTFVLNTAVTVGGVTVPAGDYTLFTIPNEGKWTLIISKKTKNAKGGALWGIPYPGEGDDLARVDMKVSSLPAPVEDFTIALDKMGDGCVLRMDWATTRA